MKIALAVFVKTPELSPTKTRLAAKLGAERALQFYELSLSAVEALVKKTHVIPYWAVAENTDSSRWNSFARVWQGEGELGARLSKIYSELLERHDFVFLMGADSPQLLAASLVNAVVRATDDRAISFIIGRAHDGGFYLFGGSKPIAPELWGSVSYSSERTASDLVRAVSKLGSVIELPEEYDVDTIDDFNRVRQALEERSTHLLREQRALLDWMRENG